MKSWKIGAIAGLIAGIVASIVFSIFIKIALSMGFWEPWWHPIIAECVEINILLGSIWGVILGIVYYKAHSIIPGKGIFKGLFYGLILYFIVTIRMCTFWLAYGYNLQVAGEILSWSFSLFAYSLTLGILYEFFCRYYPTKEKLRIKEYDLKSGILPGALAGIIGGVVASVVAVLAPAFGLWTIPNYPEIITFDFWMSQAGTHIFLNMIWGTIFGIIFAKVYNLVPGKKVLKGLIYGLTVFLITSFQIGTWYVCWAAFHNAWELAISYVSVPGIGFFNAFFFGLVLGLLYRKPTK